MSGTKFLFEYCDGKFTNEDLDQPGLDFATRYYGDDGLYLSDYQENFGDYLYIEPEEKLDFFKFSQMVDRRRESDVLTE